MTSNRPFHEAEVAATLLDMHSAQNMSQTSTPTRKIVKACKDTPPRNEPYRLSLKRKLPPKLEYPDDNLSCLTTHIERNTVFCVWLKHTIKLDTRDARWSLFGYVSPRACRNGVVYKHNFLILIYYTDEHRWVLQWSSKWEAEIGDNKTLLLKMLNQELRKFGPIGM